MDIINIYQNIYKNIWVCLSVSNTFFPLEPIYEDPSVYNHWECGQVDFVNVMFMLKNINITKKSDKHLCAGGGFL